MSSKLLYVIIITEDQARELKSVGWAIVRNWTRENTKNSTNLNNCLYSLSDNLKLTTKLKSNTRLVRELFVFFDLGQIEVRETVEEEVAKEAGKAGKRSGESGRVRRSPRGH